MLSYSLTSGNQEQACPLFTLESPSMPIVKFIHIEAHCEKSMAWFGSLVMPFGAEGYSAIAPHFVYGRSMFVYFTKMMVTQFYSWMSNVHR